MILFALNTVLTGWRRRAERPDVVIGSSPNLFAAVGAYWLSRLIGARFVLEVRDLWPQSLIDLGVSPRHPIVLLFSWMESFLYHRAQQIIVLAQGSINYISAKGIECSKIVYVPNGVHLDHFVVSATREEGRAKYGFTKFTLGYVGVNGESHGLIYLVDAMATIDDPDIELVIIGNGPARPGLMQYVQDRAIANVRFMDPVPKTEVPLVLKALDAGVLSLRRADCFLYGISPNKLFDYMAASLPVLGIIDGWVADLIHSSRCGVVCNQEDAKSISAGIRLLAGKAPDERSQMGQRGREVIQQHYNRKTWASEYLQSITV